MQIDPINWTALTHDITQWSHAHAKFPPALSAITTKKFEQRILPSHSSRSVNTKNSLAFRPSNNFFHYYDYTFPPEDETNAMKTYVRNPNDLALLSRINQHDRLAGTLGILPNHLIQLIRSHDSENLKKIVNDLRITTFWSTYNIWAKHQTLIRTYWKIIPQCCIPDTKEKKTDSQRKKRKRRTKKLVREDCKNLFHYLILKKNTHPVQGTCNCTVQICRLTTVDTRTILLLLSRTQLLTLRISWKLLALIISIPQQ